METTRINLDLPPRQRWAKAAAIHANAINELVDSYWIDLLEYEDYILSHLEAYQQHIPTAYWEEIQGIAPYCKYSAEQLLIANLYYDIVKLAFACTAFVAQDGPDLWHARNLDWFTENEALSRHTQCIEYVRDGKVVFQSIGWVGFVGVLSGLRPNGFAVTLNAIVSDAPPQIAIPISFLLRQVLETAPNYAAALALFEKTSLTGDCLLLVSGTQPGELAVVERSPNRHYTRLSEGGCIVVANDYYGLSQAGTGAVTTLADTSCHRYDRALERLQQQAPQSAADCFSILNDPTVKMTITVQQMVFNLNKGFLEIRT